jgi:hypothetical protein
VVRLARNPTVRVSGVEEEPEGSKLSHLIEAAKLTEHHRVIVDTAYSGHLATRGRAVDDHRKSMSIVM